MSNNSLEILNSAIELWIKAPYCRTALENYISIVVVASFSVFFCSIFACLLSLTSFSRWLSATLCLHTCTHTYIQIHIHTFMLVLLWNNSSENGASQCLLCANYAIPPLRKVCQKVVAPFRCKYCCCSLYFVWCFVVGAFHFFPILVCVNSLQHAICVLVKIKTR